MFTWYAFLGQNGRSELIESHETLDEALADIAKTAWEEPSNTWSNLLVDDSSGDVVATTIFGPQKELLVTLSDGRHLEYPVPRFYRDHGI